MPQPAPSPRLHLPAAITAVLLAGSLGGCASPDATGPAAGSSTAMTAEASARPPVASTSPASPETVRDRERREAWEAAFTGIESRDGRLRITAALPAEQREAAELAARTAYATNQRTSFVGARVLVVRATPEDAEAWNDLGDALVMAGRLELAAAAHATARDTADGSDAGIASRARALRSSARIIARSGDYAGAAARMRTALELAPDGSGHARMVVWLNYLGLQDDARSHLAEADRLGARVPAAVRRQLGG
jgi:tetratricopeptide (TPR) repeat protein